MTAVAAALAVKAAESHAVADGQPASCTRRRSR